MHDHNIRYHHYLHHIAHRRVVITVVSVRQRPLIGTCGTACTYVNRYPAAGWCVNIKDKEVLRACTPRIGGNDTTPQRGGRGANGGASAPIWGGYTE